MRRLADELLSYRPESGSLAWLVAAGIWISLVAFCLAYVPPRIFVPGDPAFVLTVGFIALWRYGWGGMHFSRAMIYTRLVFPRIRRRADSYDRRAPHVAVVVMSWRISPETNAAVFGAIIDDLTSYGAPATLVASVSDAADAHILEMLLARRPTARIRLIVTTQDGQGKRRALSDALGALAEAGVPPGCVVALMDGDTLLQRGTMAKCIPVLMSDSAVGAVTTDNSPLVQGRWWVREWYRLRMAQRHLTMSSMSLSRRVLVLTGRFTLFRSDVAMHPDFAATVAQDSVHHPRFGRIAMLTGDDKSTWRWTIEQGWKMLYVPDVATYPLEELPAGTFAGATVQLMLRWFGNMVRGGKRALALGPQRLGLFTYISLLDQRVSMWTSLTAPVFFLMAGLFHDPVFLVIYALWILGTRACQTVMIAAVSGRFHPIFVMLLFYSQVVGSTVKVFAFFHPHVQRWTRQNTGTPSAAASMSSWAMTAATATLFVIGIAWAGGMFEDSRRFDLWTPYLQRGLGN